jgi:hypothetical protein
MATIKTNLGTATSTIGQVSLSVFKIELIPRTIESTKRHLPALFMRTISFLNFHCWEVVIKQRYGRISSWNDQKQASITGGLDIVQILKSPRTTLRKYNQIVENKNLDTLGWFDFMEEQAWKIDRE